MNTRKPDNLYKLYLDADTSLKEEDKLINSASRQDSEYNSWFRFLKTQKLSSPAGLEDKVLTRIEAIEGRGIKYINRYISVAAAVVLIVASTFLILPRKTPGMDYGEKLALLVEAYNMLPQQEYTDNEAEEILYEDETIIIYIK